MIIKPSLKDAPEYYHYYFGLSTETDLMDALKNAMSDSLLLFSSVPKEKENYRYQPEKWTLKEVIGHIIDSERIFTYRALRFSRKDKTELLGFSENLFAPNSNAINRSIPEIAAEYKSVRLASIALFKYMNEEMLDFKGTANKVPLSSRCLGWMIAGHNVHHCKIIKERYL